MSDERHVWNHRLVAVLQPGILISTIAAGILLIAVYCGAYLALAQAPKFKSMSYAIPVDHGGWLRPEYSANPQWNSRLRMFFWPIHRVDRETRRRKWREPEMAIRLFSESKFPELPATLKRK
jgi:hypothetical protein